MRIGFLACPGTMPDSSAERRGDAFEHDLQVDALRTAIEAKGGELVEIDWHTALNEFAGLDCVLLGTVWDYQDHVDAFITKLEALEHTGIVVFNPAAMVRWNIDKHYLIDLELQGAKIIPTLWSDNTGREEIVAALNHFHCNQVVVKRQTGGGADGQHLFGKSELPDADWQMDHKAMIQPFLPAIQQEGELSFVFIDGAFSHAIQKTPATGDYRIQSLYGGQETPIDPPAEDIAAASAVLKAIPGDAPLYARIDMLRADTDTGNGSLMVMEAEVIEPFLYPVQGPELGKRMAEAIMRRMDSI